MIIVAVAAVRLEFAPRNARTLEEYGCQIGTFVHIPQATFPTFPPPESGLDHWVGKTCLTDEGGLTDVGIEINGVHESTVSPPGSPLCDPNNPWHAQLQAQEDALKLRVAGSSSPVVHATAEASPISPSRVVCV